MYLNMATANNNRSKNAKNNNTYRKRGQTKAAPAKKNAAFADEKEKESRNNEIWLFVYLAIAVFLLCSNFGWCGVAGNAVSGVIFGLFGSVSYILPVYLFFSAAFLLSNGAQRTIVKRVLCVGIFLVVIAFVCQMVNGAETVTIKMLYENGSYDKQGGGVILGGILVLMYKAIGLTGSVIVTVLLTVIGIIIVLDTSIIGFVRSGIEKAGTVEHYYGNEYSSGNEKHNRDTEHTASDKDVLSSIKVLAADDSKKKRGNKIVRDEEVHELKPIPHDNLMVEKVREETAKEKQEISLDFFNKPLSDTDTADVTGSEVSDGFELSSESASVDVPVTELAPVRRKRKKTKESTDEMIVNRDELAKEIDSHTATAATVTGTAASAGSDTATEKTTLSDAGVQEAKPYRFPPTSLLKKGKGRRAGGGEASVRETAMKLKSTLENFGVKVTITNYSCGPSVTRYELQPEQGVKVSKIVNLADDIKLNLAAADIRIEAPIPGKAAIGIEVPNKESQPVYFRDLLESESFSKFPSNIAFAVGKDISGQVIVTDIAKMPHLLIAGATGSGKSVCINTLIMSILYKANPNDVKLIMVDPKQVELSIYNGIPHMLIPVVTDPKKAAGALNWAVMEMTNRYQLFAQYNVRNLQGYNDKVLAVTGEACGNEELKKLPQIVIIVDELADLMMVAHGEVEDAIVRLSQLARAAGIHLVIATQRPSVDVITGLIKANVPSRIAMTVSSGVDSRTILDMNGAEKLLGKGDMLFYPTGYPKPVRVQGAFLSDDEIANVVDFLKEQNGDACVYDAGITEEIANTKVGSSGSASAESEYDDYFADAGKFIIGKDKASIGMLQRVYKIGFNRAARIMDQLSDAGVVGPEEGTKPRKVIMTMEEFENYVEEHL